MIVQTVLIFFSDALLGDQKFKMFRARMNLTEFSSRTAFHKK